MGVASVCENLDGESTTGEGEFLGQGCLREISMA